MDRRAFIKLAAGLPAIAVAGASAARRNRHSADALHLAEFQRNRRFAQLPAGRIAYVIDGTGPDALFLHGFPLNGFQWRHAIERLGMHRRCIAPDFLGMGHSEPAEGRSLAPEAQVDMIISLLDALGVADVDLIANDSGGAVAQLLVVRYPDRVRTLLLTNCDSEIESPPAALAPVIELARKGRFVDEWLAPWRVNPVLARSPDGIGGMCFSDPAQPTDEAIEAYFGPLLATRRRTAGANNYAVALARNALAGAGEALKRSRVPMRLVWGLADTIFSVEGADYLNRAFGHSRGVRYLQDAKLFWPEEYPDILADEARQLWGVSSF